MMKKYIAFGLALILSCVTYAQDKIKVACVGNSITYGSGVADREVNAYPVKLQGMLGGPDHHLAVCVQLRKFPAGQIIPAF